MYLAYQVIFYSNFGQNGNLLVFISPNVMSRWQFAHINVYFDIALASNY
jgi:hypothetical protein